MKTRAAQIAERIVDANANNLHANGLQSTRWDNLDAHGRRAITDAVTTVLSDDMSDIPFGAPTGPRRFVLRRFEDETGMSGVGDVAEGVQFTDGTACMRWCTQVASTAVYPSLEAVETIHGHGGRTRVVLLD